MNSFYGRILKKDEKDMKECKLIERILEESDDIVKEFWEQPDGTFVTKGKLDDVIHFKELDERSTMPLQLRAFVQRNSERTKNGCLMKNNGLYKKVFIDKTLILHMSINKHWVLLDQTKRVFGQFGRNKTYYGDVEIVYGLFLAPEVNN